jgi:tol-pal system protein YbgF
MRNFGTLPRRVALRFAALLWAGTLLGCVSQSDLKSLHGKLEDLEVEILELRKSNATGAEVNAVGTSLATRIDQLSTAEQGLASEIVSLRAEVEQLEAKLDDTHFRLAQLLQQIAATQQELQTLRAAAAEPRRPAPPALPRASNDPQTVYDTAYADYSRGNLDLAVVGFRQFLELEPRAELTDNALYWLGECFYRQAKFNKAIDQFDQVLTRFPNGDRVASALLKKGYAYLEMGQRAQGIVQLQAVACEHRGKDEAELARKRLAELSIDVDC